MRFDNKHIKVLHLFNQYLPQSENWAYHLIANCPNIKVFIGAKEYLKNNFYHPSFTFLDQPHSSLLPALRQLGNSTPTAIFRKLSLKLLPLLLGDCRAHILRQARQHNIQLIHAHFADNAWYFKDIAKRLNVPFVVSFYGWDYEMLPHIKPVYKDRYTKLFELADLFLCEGEHGRRLLIKKGCPPHKVKVLRLGVEIDRIPVYQRHKEKGGLNLVQIASFTEKKGHIYTVQAFKKATQKCPNMQLTLVGGEREPGRLAKIRNYVDSHKLNDKIQFVEGIDYSQLYSFLKQFHVFIHPSCYAENRDCEGGAPVVLLDAQATGMPVISTQHCDIPQEVIHNKTGMLAEETDIHQLSDYIQQFYRMDQATYDLFAHSARTHVEANFDISKNAIKLYRIYQELIER